MMRRAQVLKSLTFLRGGAGFDKIWRGAGFDKNWRGAVG